MWDQLPPQVQTSIDGMIVQLENAAEQVVRAACPHVRPLARRDVRAVTHPHSILGSGFRGKPGRMPSSETCTTSDKGLRSTV